MRRNVPMDDFLQAGFVNRHLARLKRFHFARVVIDADDVMPDVSKAGAGHEADITGTDDGKIHV